MNILLPKGAVVVDIGAHVGPHAIALAHQVGPTGRVYAFEPQRTLFNLLCGNAALNGYYNVKAEQLALSDKEGYVEVRTVGSMG